MSHKQGIFSLKLATGMTVITGLLVAGMFCSQQSSAQKLPRIKAQRWEYCAIIGAHSDLFGIKTEKHTGVATICYFRSSGCHREQVSFELTYADFLKEANPKQGESYNRNYAFPAKATEAALSKAIARLGDDGWEMIGENRIDFSSPVDAINKAIFFKRRPSH
jgi:hypothetical protein